MEGDHMNQSHDIAQETIPYETRLRSVGAFIDEHGGTRVHVRAVPEGFTVSYQSRTDDADPHTCLLGFGELAARARGPHPRGEQLSREGAENRRTYENVFRSLGRELQEAGGDLLALDEIDDGVVLSYRHPGRVSGDTTTTRRVTLRRDDATTLLAHGVDRRGADPSTGSSIGADTADAQGTDQAPGSAPPRRAVTN
jgi:hypothetical protein